MSDLNDLRDRVERAGEAARGRLLAERNANGWWEGELSASALSTAVAVLALGEFEQTRSVAQRAAGNIGKDKKDGRDLKDVGAKDAGGEALAGNGEDLILAGLRWMAGTQLGDGGWGDTVRSRANVATTLLVWAAFGLGVRVLEERGHGMEAGAVAEGGETQGALCPSQWGGKEAGFLLDFAAVVARAEGWIRKEAGGLEVGKLKAALARRYGKDKTFAVPILMACAVGGRLGAAPGCWREVPALPFELAAFPRTWFAALRLPVVSYALPALIAIGQVRHFHAPVRGPWRWVRRAAVGRTRRLLREIQPEGGGFLEAIPLTGFVTMALCSAGAGDGEVVREAVDFLRRSVRADGSWLIDTNLATWGTTLSVKALGGGGDLPEEDRAAVRGWLLGQQYKERHPYCLSAPGGWAWTDLPGGVPDADDTAGALLALRELGGPGAEGDRKDKSDGTDGADRTDKTDGKLSGSFVHREAEAGVRWLVGLQNGDGGMPTFCKGWGALPFDRSAPDLTAHALAAWQVWRGEVAVDVQPAMLRAVAWLRKTQRADGAWLPLWFGNEHEADEGNPVYGTAVVLKYLCRLSAEEFAGLAAVRGKAAAFLNGTQQAEGSWSGGMGGGPGSIEETGAALEALVAFAGTNAAVPQGSGAACEIPALYNKAVEQGAAALLRLTAEGTDFPPAPIGLYFARLWYYEKLYPQIAAVAAFRVLRGFLARRTG